MTLIRRIRQGEEEIVSRLVQEVFDEFVSPLYEQEGIEEFLRYIDPNEIAERSGENHFTLLAEESNNIVGVIELRECNHISLLFVAGGAQRKGIARRLLNESIEIAQHIRSGLNQVSVHSSPNAVEAYERLGFEVEGPEKIENGIRYIPMKLKLADHDDD